ncbi:Uncharacterised protein [BD1-7 clade bacterium]|uniref:Uncharacterized protein n=1 Tax=BD1-7 clade bacterium TaxID=2029982 RepID=A0A5S9QF44_9GAMM|nr:Uncharacterised protein [BD1-7 clade bacterium]CAA0116543.1 Uncharacterised protein [BD1-7 clade bacterium]CAA0120172.1 Uncharacterised protein [BD1-7 clade bacterium]
MALQTQTGSSEKLEPTLKERVFHHVQHGITSVPKVHDVWSRAQLCYRSVHWLNCHTVPSLVAQGTLLLAAVMFAILLAEGEFVAWLILGVFTGA